MTKRVIRVFVAAGLLACAGRVSAQQASSKAPPLSPEESMKTMVIQDGFRLVPVLTEPVIHEPAAVAWDGNGRLYVVEMRTYMQDIDGRNQLTPTSRVSRHEDVDGDGIYEKHTVFADKLSLPRMVLPLLDRVIIRETNTLDLKSYRDTDGDGVADAVEMWHQGGKRGGNLEHQPSGLIWNVDNWIYTTYSRHRYRCTGGTVIRSNLPHGAGQWGLTHDDTGRIFYSSAGGENPATDFQRPIVYGRISLRGEQAPGFREVFPIDNVPDTQGGRKRLRQNNTLNRFTASCGQSVYRGDRMPEGWHGDLIICEPVGRLVRRAKVTNEDGKIVVSNAYDGKEFIAARDPNFRPINSATGPDGCLYIVDMYRGIIQEGNWVRKGSYLRGVVQQYELDKNIGRGRIYRVTHPSVKPGPKPRMLDETPAQLVAHLSHPNGWWRSEAQKLIILHGNQAVVPALEKLARTGREPMGRFHALWTLEGLGAVTPDLVSALFKDRDARVRAAALRVAEGMMATERSLDAGIRKLAQDRDADVAIQVMLSVLRGGHPEAIEITDSIIAANASRSAVKDIGNQVKAGMASLVAERRRLAEMERRNALLAGAVRRGSEIFQTLCITCHGPDGKGVPSPDVKGMMQAPPLAGSPRVRGHKDRVVRILLQGLIGPVEGKRYAAGLMMPMGANDDAWIADVLTYVRNSFGNQAPLIEAGDVKRIRDATRGRTDPWTLAELVPFDPPRLKDRSKWRLTASHNKGALGNAIDGDVGSRWDTATPQKPGMWLRIQLPESTTITGLTLDSSRSASDYPRGYRVEVSSDGLRWGKPVAEGRGTESVLRIEFDAPTTGKYIRIRQTGKARGKFWSIHDLHISGVPAGQMPAGKTLAQELAAMDAATLARGARTSGDARRGAAVFYNPAVSCAKCHDPASGPRLGPDLAGKRDGVSDVMLVESVLHPSKLIRKGFEPIIVRTARGDVRTGFKIREDATTLVLRDPSAGEKPLEFAKKDLSGTKMGTLSMMPAGLANQLADRKEFLDLARFLMDVYEQGPARMKELRKETAGR